ncbi:MAG TPA: TonB-dependent receptor [Bacteroidales bacterium]|nr:TonB-dependent receptor [Bacteroidales bacterium]HPT11388.1 TonB-dependent receptor [Bacteroidales bacterium]
MKKAGQLKLTAVLLFALCNITIHAQMVQTIKGTVIDKNSKVTLAGASVFIPDSDPLRGAVTDQNGNFRLDNIETGRVRLCIRYLGYEQVCLDNLNLTSGKELVLNIEIEESVTSMSEVVVKAQQDKTTAINTMSAISSRTFSVEESQRYAGARNDVARMAVNYAGVSVGNDATNEIVIRGNSPNGLLWMLEGVEIPNPNHFGTLSATAGPVGMLNNNTLSNSDFMTGAFAADYGNAVSGVFDLKMREGNHDKHEFLGQVGFNGFELGAEGPVSRKHNASYLVNYRYSTLGLLHAMGVSFGTGTAIPEYQDLSFKITSDLGKGKISLFGLAGLSSIKLLYSREDSADVDNYYGSKGLDIYDSNYLGFIGMKYFARLSPGTYANITFSADAAQNRAKVDTVLTNPKSFRLNSFARFNAQDYIANFSVNSKISDRINTRIGGEMKYLNYSLIDSTYLNRYNAFFSFYDDKGSTVLLRGFAEFNRKFSDKLSLNAGMHVMYLTLNDELIPEPRIALKYKPSANHVFSIGYGNHSRILPMYVYFTRVDLSATEYYQPNRDLKMLKANHLVASWDWQINKVTRVKIEGYYQHLYNAVIEKKSSGFSMLNDNSFQYYLPDTLVNGGTGDNKGIELTVEQFMNKGLYYLVTTSLFDSKYKGSDKITRPTAFDGGYVVNALAGKEFLLKSKKTSSKKYLSTDMKLTAAGGRRYTPVDVEESIKEGETVYDKDRAYSVKFKDYFRLDLRLAYRVDKKKFSHEWVIDVQNVTNHKNPLYMEYNTDTGKTEFIYQLSLYPMMQYRIVF